MFAVGCALRQGEIRLGPGGRDRTGTGIRPTDFKSVASTNSATPGCHDAGGKPAPAPAICQGVARSNRRRPGLEPGPMPERLRRTGRRRRGSGVGPGSRPGRRIVVAVRSGSGWFGGRSQKARGPAQPTPARQPVVPAQPSPSRCTASAYCSSINLISGSQSSTAPARREGARSKMPRPRRATSW